MGSEADNVEAASASTVDSDGSVTWEDFFGTTTDLVPQLLGMFDELARRGNGYGDHVVLSASCNIPAVLQKRLSLVPHSHRGSIFGQLCSAPDNARSHHEDEEKDKGDDGDDGDEEDEDEDDAIAMCERVEGKTTSMTCEDGTVSRDDPTKSRKENTVSSITDRSSGDNRIEKTSMASTSTSTTTTTTSTTTTTTTMTMTTTTTTTEEKTSSYRQETGGLSSLRYNRRCRAVGRPLSGSSIASSTSSSGCSNQGNARTANPYLASVESLADTCASSQGSGDSGIVTVSESSCRIGNSTNGQRRETVEGESPCHRPRYCDRPRNPVERVLLEIVDTEAIYVEHLRQVIQGYLIFWRDDPASFVRQLQLNHLFSNIEDIFEFNREFLKELEKCNLDPVCVANTFIKHNSGFKVYTEYCTNYPRTVSVLTDLMGKEETASAFRERQAALGHALPLGSFLLKPVQRILKYHLLLDNLSKEYGADCDLRENEAEGRTAIEGALAAMTGIAKHINAMKRRHEHAVRVQEIQSLLYGWPGPDLTTSGELVAEGRFRMRGAKAPRHAFLFDRMLLLTKKKEDGLLVYKAHIMCSNLMLIESIPGEPLSFHVIPFDNPRLQYTLQARNKEQKREWTLQIKRVILENYNAVIPSHARQLVLQLGQTQPEDDTLTDKSSGKKQYSAPPEYLEKRKQERERRRSETGLRQKLKKCARKSDSNTNVIEDSPASLRKNHSEDLGESREQTLNRTSDGRTLKVKDRFTGWRRKSEPGFQSYVCLNQSDEEQKEDTADTESATAETECLDEPTTNGEAMSNSSPITDSKEKHEQSSQAQTVEEIVGHILMQNQEFQKLLEKQRTSSIIHVRQQQRFNKRISADTSDESDSENTSYPTESTNNRTNRVRAIHREQRLMRTNNAWNSLSSSSTRDNQPSLHLLYDNFKNGNDTGKTADTATKNVKTSRVHEKKAVFDAFKRQSIVTESKVIKTALRIRENSISGNEESTITSIPNNVHSLGKEKEPMTNSIATNESDETTEVEESKGFGNYDNLQHVWEGLQEERDMDGSDSPTRPAVWLTKLCEGLPTSPQKCGSLPRSFQINPNSHPGVTKSRFLQRDGKPISERPFTIASDKPAEINLEDMERYASNCQPEGRIAKFPTSVSASTSTFFYSLDDTLTDAYSEIHESPTITNIHPDHKIYRANGNTIGSTIFKNVLSKAGNRLQGLRNTVSTETLECSEEFERTKYFRSLSGGVGKSKRKGKSKHSRESSSDIEELVGCVASGTSDFRVPSLYYKQGSSGLGARIAQSDYADPAVLFAENKRLGLSVTDNSVNESKNGDLSLPRTRETDENTERRESEADSFYERSFETIENYVDADVDEAFRDSAIFSDIEDVLVLRPRSNSTSAKETTTTTPKHRKTAPPIPAKKRSEFISACNVVLHNAIRSKPNVAQKPDYLKVRSIFAKGGQNETEDKTPIKSTMIKDSGIAATRSCTIDGHRSKVAEIQRNISEDRDDVSAGQSQAGWVRKIVGQLQGHIET